MIMSDVGWTLWAAIQARISTIDYDFTGWAEERWARAATALDGPDYENWLQTVHETLIGRAGGSSGTSRLHSAEWPGVSPRADRGSPR